MSLWVCFKRLMSYPSILKILIGNRGGGKSYGAKKECVDMWLKTKRKFIWLRRYGTEIFGTPKQKEETLAKSFWKDIIKNNEYPEHELTTKSNGIYIDGELAGAFVALSTSQKEKSIPFDDFDLIVFDEFIISKKRYTYLPNEVEEFFLEFIETVNRLRVGPQDTLQVLLIANAIKFANPYFLYFGIPKFNTEFWTDKKRGITVQMVRNEEFIETKKKTRFGRLISGTRYEEYAVDNEFLLDNNKFIKSKSKNARFVFAIRYGRDTLGFWIDYNVGECYVNKSYPNTTHNLYTLRADDQDVNMLLIKRAKSTLVDNAVYLFTLGKMFYENNVVKTLALEIMQYFT